MPVVMVEYFKCCIPQCGASTMILGSPDCPDSCDSCGHIHCQDCDDWQQAERTEYWTNKKIGHNCKDCGKSCENEKKEMATKGEVKK